MEDTLRGNTPLFLIAVLAVVLILVLMEDTLRASAKTQTLRTSSLNPCFNGRYSQSYINKFKLNNYGS